MDIVLTFKFTGYEGRNEIIMKCLKHIAMKNVCNLRDLGGYPASDACYTKWGMLYRSDALSGLTDEEWDVLAERGVRTVIDLRGNSEVAQALVSAPSGITYYHFSLMQELDHMMDEGGQDPADADRSAGEKNILGSMKLDYAKSLFGNMECCVKILSTITERLKTGGIVFMCSAGKDRTGMIAALILYLCGVAREDIIADYMVSNTYNSNGINKKLSGLPESVMQMIPDMDVLKDLFASKPETMIQFLDELGGKDIRKVLNKSGFTGERQEILRELFTEKL